MTRFFVKHPVTTWMIFAAFIVLGIYSFPKLQIEAIPEIDLPTITIFTSWHGASPLAVQRSITVPIEEAVQKVRGVEKVKSTSSAGRSQVEVSFRRNINIDFARVELNEQLGSIRRNLPLNANQPQIVPYIPEEFKVERFFTFSLESSLNPNELRELAEEWVVPRLLALEGVADASVLGGARPLIKIVLDRKKLELYGITPDEVFSSLSRMDDIYAIGVVQENGLERSVSLRDPVILKKLKSTLVTKRGARLFTLSMLGEVRLDFEDPTYFVRANARNVIQVNVEKRSGANTIAVSNILRKTLPKLEKEVPFNVNFHIDDDQGKDLEQKLRELVYRSLIILGLLFLLLTASLRQIRLTTVITGSIIFSVVIALSLFYFLRISVNFITISGLTVCFGMILDNSILVLDAIHRRLFALKRADEAGLSRRSKLKVAIETVIGGADEVLFPILATTLTTIVAFGSFIFLSGRLSLYYMPLAVSVATALVASLFVAFGWVPVILNNWWASRLARESTNGPNEINNPRELAKFTEDLPDLEAKVPITEKMFNWTQKTWWLLIPCMLGILVWQWRIYDTKVMKGGFWRMPDKQELIAYMEMPSGTDVKLTSETFRKFEDALLPLAPGTRLRSQAWGNQAFLRLEFSDSLIKTEIPMYYRTLLMDIADHLGGSSIFIFGFSDTPYIKGSFQGSALNSLVKVTGYNSKKLKEICEGILQSIQKNRRVRNARVTTGRRFVRIFQDEIVIDVDRDKLAAYNLSVLEVVAQLRRLMGVDYPWTMLIEGEHKRVQLSFSDADTVDYTKALQTLIRNTRGEKVRLSDLVNVAMKPLTGTIVRENQKYSSYINWEYIGTDAMRKAFIKKVLNALDLPYGYEAEEATQEFFTQKEKEELTMTILLAIAFIFMVLAALFESITLPFIVLLSVPLSLIGVFLAFWWTSSTFDSSARIGLILLFGIVVNNAILLISRYRTEASLVLKVRRNRDPELETALFPGMRKRIGGSDLWVLESNERPNLLRRAIARGTRIRIRSILLISSTTIVGLAPLLLHFHETKDKDIWENLALASIGGLAASTLLILLFIPPTYYLCVRINWIWRGMLAKLQRKKGKVPQRNHDSNA